MALSLTAEQKELIKIFKIEEQYVVPAYQRPYSWEYEQCYQLYTDLINAFESNQDYFIGNIIIAKGESNKDFLEIIDGQQRLITLLLLIKVLNILKPDYIILQQLLEKENWQGTAKLPRIKSDIFERGDGNELNSALNLSENELQTIYENNQGKNGNVNQYKGENRFEANILYLYSWLLFYKKSHNNLEAFITYLLRNVYLLPIQLTGKTQLEANEKALVIFETINNRGMNLADADIFKAKLYDKARKVNEEDYFISSWGEFKVNCEKLNLDIDDIFKYYSHIIRGKEGITSSEINLREFFNLQPYSPFATRKYKDILSDLFKIIDIVEFFNQEKHKETELAKWLQLIDIYSNQYPKIATVNYFFVNGFEITLELQLFLKSLIRYVYFHGSTTYVKFEIYSIIKQVSAKQTINNYYKDINHGFFNTLGRLKYGYALLAFYLENEVALSVYNIDKIITFKDIDNLPEGWDLLALDDAIERLGNFVVLDIGKRNLNINAKKIYYNNSKIDEVRNLLNDNFSYQKFNKRNELLLDRLINFFSGNE